MKERTAVGTTEAGMSRRQMLTITSGVALGLAAAARTGRTQAVRPDASTWDKTFPKSDLIAHRKVSYTNRLGISLVADLYIPKDIDRSKRHPAVIVGHPFGGVKEQTSGLYAQTMAERGFVTLAHDASYGGESGAGLPHHIFSADAYVDDFSAGVDFLGRQDYVDRERIGVIGICASGGFALAAAQVDPRIRAVATSVMYDMGASDYGGLTTEDYYQAQKRRMAEAAEQRWREVDGAPMATPGLPEEYSEDLRGPVAEFFDYYRTPRGAHPRSTTGMSMTSAGSLFFYRPFEYLAMISPRPVLMITGENAHSKFFTDAAFEAASEPKELHIVPGAGHVDLYDRVELIPFDKLEAFLTEHLG